MTPISSPLNCDRKVLDDRFTVYGCVKAIHGLSNFLHDFILFRYFLQFEAFLSIVRRKTFEIQKVNKLIGLRKSIKFIRARKLLKYTRLTRPLCKIISISNCWREWELYEGSVCKFSVCPLAVVFNDHHPHRKRSLVCPSLPEPKSPHRNYII